MHSVILPVPLLLNGNNTSPYVSNESVAVPIASWALVFIHTIVFIASLTATIMRRKQPRVKVRNLAVVVLTLVSQYLVGLNLEVRLGVHRWTYPCLLYSMHFGLSESVIAFSLLARTAHIFFSNRFQFARANMYQYHHQSSHNMQQHNHHAQEENNVQRYYNSQNTGTTSNSDTLLRYWSFAVSLPFTLLLFSGFIFVGVVFWVICWASYTGDKSVFFSFRSCDITVTTTIIILAQAALYSVFQLVLIITLLWFHVKESWLMRAEVLCSSLIWAVTIVLFATTNLALFTCCYSTLEFYWPSSHYVTIACILDSLLVGLIPPLATVVFNPTKVHNTELSERFLQEPIDDYEDLLYDDDLREGLKLFMIQHLCVEYLLFWEDVMLVLHRARSATHSIETAERILANYIEDQSPIEFSKGNMMGLPALRFAIENFKNGFQQHKRKLETQNEYNEPFDELMIISLFDPLAKEAELYMKVLISKFTKTRKYEQILAESLRREEQIAKTRASLEGRFDTNAPQE